MTGTGFTDTVNSFRCPARVDVGRCGLYASHDGAHAYGEIVSRRPWRDRVWRWDDDTVPWVEDTAPRLAWCALHHD